MSSPYDLSNPPKPLCTEGKRENSFLPRQITFSYPDSQYTPQRKSQNTGNYLWQKLLIQEFFHLLQKAT